RDTAIRRAMAMREAAVAQAQADQERVVAQTASETKQAEATRDLEVKRAEYEASVRTQRATAEKAYDIAANQAQQKVIAEQVRIAAVGCRVPGVLAGRGSGQVHYGHARGGARAVAVAGGGGQDHGRQYWRRFAERWRVTDNRRSGQDGGAGA